LNKRFLNIKYFSIDFLASLLAWIIFFIFRKEYMEQAIFGKGYNIEIDINFYLGIIIIPIFWTLIYYFLGSYKNVFKKSRLREVSNALLITFLGSVVIFFAIILDDFVSKVTLLRTSFIVYFFLQFFIISIPRLIFLGDVKRKLKNRVLGFKTLLVGDIDKITKIYYELEKQPYSQGYLFQGFLSDDNSTEQINGSLKKLGSNHEVIDMVNQLQIEEVILAFNKRDDDHYYSIIKELGAYNVKLKIVPDMYDLVTGTVKMNYIFGTALIEINPELMPVWQKNIKRLIDVVFSSAFMLIFSPFYLLLGLMVKISSKGPSIYKQERIGLGGKPFKIYKFRTMFIDAESLGPQLSSESDPRITKLGRQLRKYRLDEFPQFFNVILGEMSLVGPRPERQFFINQITAISPEYNYLLKVRPGITSWGQIKYGYAENVDQMVERLKFDLLYIENMTLAMDIKILFYTVVIMLQGRGK